MSTKAGRPANQSASRCGKPPRFDRWHFTFFVLGIGLTVWFSFLVSNPGHAKHQEPSPASRETVSAAAPWGAIEYTAITLERPEESLESGGTAPASPRWYFPGVTEAQIARWLADSGMTPAQASSLMDTARWTRWQDGWAIAPPPDTVRRLDPKARQKIYAVLARCEWNAGQRHPFSIAADRFPAWLGDTGLPEERKQDFLRMTYRAGDRVCFSDFEVMEALCSPAERKFLAKAISQYPALLMKLRVGPDSDPAALLRYWGRGSRGKAMKPFLESVAHTAPGESLSVSFFFPTFARMRLYTYPDSAVDPTAQRQDCYWTALNFFNEVPDDRFFNEQHIQWTLRNEYAEVRAPWTFGDLIMLLEDGKKTIHLCVYVADDVVFTKNGVSTIRPWVLMKIADMLAFYRAETGQPVEAIGLRPKPAS